MQNLCLIEEQFDAERTISDALELAGFDLSPSGNCEVFVQKLPNFDIKTRKQ